MKKILVAAGGTGGHIIPAISIIKELQKHNIEVLYVGNKNSMEEKLTKQQNIPFVGINVQKFYRKLTWAHLKFPFKLLKSITDSLKIIKQFQPDAFIGTGGFVSGPVGYAAKMRKIPIFLQEQNSFPGATTRILSRYAHKIFLGNKDASNLLPQNKLIFSGNPVNTNILTKNDKLDLNKIGLKTDTVKLFLMGGSQGSLALNNALYPIIDDLLANGIEILWQVGQYSFAEFSEKLKNKTGIHTFDFSNEIDKFYNTADFVLTRAGALSLAELESKKLPAILIPLPTAAENHQYYNALELAKKKVAVILEQTKLTPQVLKETILNMKDNYLEMKQHFSRSIHLDAANKIATEIVSFLEKGE